MDKWDSRFMAMAKLVASWSKDPSTGCGAVIVDSRQRIVSTAFNGFPRRVDDDPDRLHDRRLKLALTLHAEANSVIFAERPIRGCTLYVHPMPPCSRCAALIIQAGISRVVAPAPAPDLADRWGESIELAVMAMREAGVKVDILDNLES